MNERSLRVLEYERIKEMLVACTSSALGRELAQSLLPATDTDHVHRLLSETSEARTIHRTEEFPLKGLYDTRAAIRRAVLGAMVEASDLALLSQVLAVARRVRSFFASRQEEYPCLALYGLALTAIKDLEDEINRCIGEGGEVLDSASDRLRRLRHDIRAAQTGVKSRLDSMIRSASMQKYLQETIVTVRNGRYVLPVKAEYKGQVPGIIHDQSGSGATLFVEPMSIVEVNNRLRQAEAQEEQEVERILRLLSERVAAYGDELNHNMKNLAELDLCLAKGRFSYAQKCTEPELDRVQILLRGARHPLISPSDVVPIDVKLGGEFTALLITGPNTGGKTVTLKTIGLLTLMAQSGLHIPAAEGSRIKVFGAVFADIGDEQSIEQSLSTFSSHMTNIRGIVRDADHETLVLLDELGAGTDPAEGAALAMSIVDSLYARGSYVVATTHYSELKAYAHTRAGVENASVEFDIETLSPTYRLSIGLPGKSNAFEISARLGLDPHIIEQARHYLSSEALKVEDLLQSLAAAREDLEEKRRTAASELRQAEKLRQESQAQLERQQQKETQAINRARDEARSIVQRAKHEMEDLLAELRKAQENQSPGELGRTMEAARQRWKAASDETAPSELPAPRERLDTSPELAVGEGDEVVVSHLNQRGRVISVHGDTAMVQIGAMRANLPLSSMQRARQEKSSRPASSYRVVSVASRVGMELDLRGETVESAIMRIDKYLDDAMMSGFAQVHLIHGKGTGALRTGIQEYLRNHPAVESFRLGQAGEGGSGVTVVRFQTK